jgi:oligopeptide transport system substrate-binding protein
MEWSAALKMYADDDLDILDLGLLPPPELDRVWQQHAGEYLSVPWLATIYVLFDPSRPPFDDVRVRQAFALATNRETLASVMPRGYGFPATGGFIPPGMPGHSPGISLPCDLEQAQRLMTEAGYPDGKGFPVIKAVTPKEREPLGKNLQAQWHQNIGVKITWQALDYTAFIERLYWEKLPSVSLHRWIADYPDPDNFLRVCPSLWLPKWGNKTYAGLVEEARRSVDQEERMNRYKRADKILQEEAVIIPLNYGRWNLLIKPWVKKSSTVSRSFWFWKDVIIESH